MLNLNRELIFIAGRSADLAERALSNRGANVNNLMLWFETKTDRQIVEDIIERADNRPDADTVEAIILSMGIYRNEVLDVYLEGHEEAVRAAKISLNEAKDEFEEKEAAEGLAVSLKIDDVQHLVELYRDKLAAQIALNNAKRERFGAVMYVDKLRAKGKE
jgi:hypothetical protein